MENYNPNIHPLITVITSNSNPLGKKYPKTTAYQPGVLLEGTFLVCFIVSMLHLYNLLKDLTKMQVILLGVPKIKNCFAGKMVSKKMKKLESDLTRSKQDIGWNLYNGLAYVLIDIDSGDVPGFVLNTAKEVFDFLVSLDPELSKCAILVKNSSSQSYQLENKGWHVYIKVCNANEDTVKEYAKTLQAICWTQKLGHIKISKSGSLLVRQVFDMAVFSPERLIIESHFSDDKDVVFHQIPPYIQEGLGRVL